MGHLERGEKNVSFNTLVRLADALRITIGELVSEGRARRVRGHRTASGTITSKDPPGIILELNHRRRALEETADILRSVVEVLRKQQRKKRRKKS